MTLSALRSAVSASFPWCVWLGGQLFVSGCVQQCSVGAGVLHNSMAAFSTSFVRCKSTGANLSFLGGPLQRRGLQSQCFQPKSTRISQPQHTHIPTPRDSAWVCSGCVYLRPRPSKCEKSTNVKCLNLASPT
jgi:hypothetical protein